MLTENELEEIRRKMLLLEDEPPAGGWNKIKADIQPPGPWRPVWWLLGLLLLLGTGVGVLLLQEGGDWLVASGPRQKATPLAIAPEHTTAMQREQQETFLAVPEAGAEKHVAPQGLKSSIEGQETDKRSADQPKQVSGESTTAGGESTTAGQASSQGLIESGRESSLPHKDAMEVASEVNPERLQLAKAVAPQAAQQEPVTQASVQHAEEALENTTATTDPSTGSTSKTASPVAVIPGAVQADPEQSGTQVTKPLLVAEVTSAGNNSEHKSSSTAKDISLEPAKLPLQPLKPLYQSNDLPLLKPVAARLDTKEGFFEKRMPSEVPLSDTLPQLHEMPIVPVDRDEMKKEWGAGVFFAPRYTYRAYTPRANDEVLITSVSNKEQSARDRMGYELGLSFYKRISSRLQLETSLGYMKLKENLSYTYTTGQLESMERSATATGEVLLNPVYVVKDRQLASAYAYANWRLATTYFLWQNNRRRYHFTAGAGASLLLNGSTKIYQGGELVETLHFPSKENILEQSNYQLMIGFGYNRMLFSSWELSVTPMLNYFLGSTYQEREPIGLKSYSLGIHLQLRRRFNYKPAAFL